MVEAVLEEVGDIPPSAAEVGMGVLGVLTTGMYGEPMMVLREYVQNAVDAIDEAVEKGVLDFNDAIVDVTLDGRNRILRVLDNGIGVSNDEAEQSLCAIGRSSKREGKGRGFRGIGRLGGIGYCDRVQFETRSFEDERVAVVDWDCIKLRAILASSSKELSAEDAVRLAVRIRYRAAEVDDLPHFFRVQLFSVHHFHKDDLTSLGSMRGYLSEVAPVPFDRTKFSLSTEIDAHLAEVDGYRCYSIQLNGHRLYRPHTMAINIGPTRKDEIRGIELFEIKANGRPLARGWYAKTQLLASLPRQIRMRGVRVRQGNFEVGHERSLEGIYTESRFALWHIGELHVGYCLKPNARRDGFEQSVEHESFIEQMNVLGHHLSHLCRASSSSRSAQLVAEGMLRRVESLLNREFAVDEQDLERTRAETVDILRTLQGLDERARLGPQLSRRLGRASGMLNEANHNRPFLRDVLDESKLRHLDAKALLESIAKAILEYRDKDFIAEPLVEQILKPYLQHVSGTFRMPTSADHGRSSKLQTAEDTQSRPLEHA